ncbi:hypothetical protein EZ428_17140 [Pedobacter frigiditerrae]|uniref:Uncharacterized protein n=1 Tax=Pedobacter frigiditerrae TaxID=2530452 RepID=A0A4R0MR60_9SPHI|nr:hypothetical protein [Pedobacter frigiditerrae]TCC89419.1 hypothetical protein EZ428_17140 [Pedobacter frigiditerrae]
MRNIIVLFLMLICSSCFAQNADINNFLVKESLLKNSKLAIIAADSLENPLEQINGTYTFSVSGFTQQLTFNDGVAILPLAIDKSTFVYIKHQNDRGTHSKLLYVYKKEGNLNPFTISRIFLIIIPLIIVVLAFAFKKFIYIAVVLLIIFMIFSYSNGLNISTFFETTFDYLRNLV